MATSHACSQRPPIKCLGLQHCRLPARYNQLLRTVRRRSTVTHAKRSRLDRLAEELKAEQMPIVTKIEWDSPLQIIKYPDPKLRAVNARVQVFDDSLARLAKEMFAIMYNEPGVGLAAPQVGVNVRLMVFNPTGDQVTGKEYILVNPEIVDKNRELKAGEEGCLSFPGIFADVERFTEIVVKFQNERGEPTQLSLKGWNARIFQHEYDHLQGVLFHDRMKPDQLQLCVPKLVEMEEVYLAAKPDAKVRRVVAPPEGPPPPPAQPAGGFGGFGFGAKKK